MKKGQVYILTNKNNKVLYVGVTSDLVKRVWQHRNGFVSSFTKRYNVHKLIYFEIYDSIEEAIIREKQLKAGSRRKKETLINNMNPEWNDIETLTEALKNGAVRYPQSGLLGESGNILLFGHSTHLKIVHNKAYKAFNDLENLVAGDEIKIYSGESVYTYKVETVQLVKNEEAQVDFFSTTPKLTLVTCNNFGAKEDRFIVVAELVSVSSLNKK